MIRVGDDIAIRSRSDDEVGRICVAGVFQEVALLLTCFEGCRVTGVKDASAIAFVDGDRARKHIDHLILILVPVSEGRF